MAWQVISTAGNSLPKGLGMKQSYKTRNAKLNEQELTIARFLGANGLSEKMHIINLMEQRSLFQAGCSQFINAMESRGMIERYDNCCWLSKAGKALLRDTLQEACEGSIEEIKQLIWPEFQKLDIAVKQVFTEWQIMPNGRLNAHLSPEYDFEVLEKLQDIHKRVIFLIESENTLYYSCFNLLTELKMAMDRIDDGNFEFILSLNVNSYHNLWREMHEHLLSILGLERKE